MCQKIISWKPATASRVLVWGCLVITFKSREPPILSETFYQMFGMQPHGSEKIVPERDRTYFGCHNFWAFWDYFNGDANSYNSLPKIFLKYQLLKPNLWIELSSFCPFLCLFEKESSWKEKGSTMTPRFANFYQMLQHKDYNGLHHIFNFDWQIVQVANHPFHGPNLDIFSTFCQ